MNLKAVVKSKKTHPINFKVSEEDMELIQKKAQEYTNGNVSEWMRYAAKHHDPRASELVGPESEC